MRRVTAVFLFAIASLSAMAEEKVTLVNSSFEEAAGPAAGGQPDWTAGPPGWHTWFSQIAKASGGVVNWEATGGRTGARCVSLKKCAGNACVIQHGPIAPGRAYVCSAWTKRTSPASKARLVIRFAKADRSWESNVSVIEEAPVETASEWTRLDAYFTAPKEAAFAVIMLQASDQKAEDVCWFDDVELTALDPGSFIVSSCNWMHPNLRPEGPPVETHHLPWAKPAAWGKVRALFFCKDGHALREPFELAQRMDVDLDYVIASAENKGWFALNNTEIMQRIRENYYDAMVVTGKLDADTVAYLAKHAKGIVFLQAPWGAPKTLKLAAVEGGNALLEPSDAMPEIVGADKDGKETRNPALKFLRTGELNGTRLLEIGYHGSPCYGLTPNLSFDYHLRTGALYWEAYLQLVARTLLCAAGREMPARLVLDYAEGKFRLDGPAGEVETVFADKGNNIVRAAARAPGMIEIPTSVLPGAVACFVTARDSQGRVTGFACARGGREAQSAILSLEPDKPFYAEGEKAQVTIRVKNAGGMRLRVALEDAFGRVHAKAETPAGESATAALDPSNRLSAFNWVNAALMDGERLVDEVRRYVLVPLSREEWLKDYQVGTWNAAGYLPQYAEPTYHRMLRETEHTEGLQGAAGYLAMLSAGLWPISTAYARVPGYSPHKTRETVRTPCLSDPAVRQKMAETAREIAAKEMPYRPLFGYLHDETSLVDSGLDVDTCSCEFCVRRYRDWLKQRYPSLDALNQEWGTSYGAWDDIGFVAYKDIRGKPTFAPWVMYRRFMDWAWAEGVEWTRRHGRQADPGLMLALANTFGPNPFSGRDYYLMCGANDYWMEYNCETRSPMPGGAIRFNFDAVRCFGPNLPNHPWIGYRFEDEYIRFAPWWTALHGATGVAPYGAMSFGPPQGSWAVIFPTLQHTRRGRLYAKELQELKSGIGKLLMNMKRAPAPVAILWSQPSMYVAWAASDQEGNPNNISKKNAYSRYFQSRQAFRQSALAGGRQFDYVSEEQVMQGALRPYRAVALPAAYAISEKLAQELERFVRDGGLLVADADCGLTNEAGRPYADGGPMKKLLDPARPPGKGRTVLLEGPAAESPLTKGLWDGLPRIAEVTSLDGKKSPADYELVLLQDGEQRCLGVLHDYLNDEENYPVRLKLANKAHVYDMRTAQYLGERDAIECDLPPGGCAMYSLSPHRVEGLQIRSAAAEAGKPCSLECEAAGGGKGVRVLRVEAVRPDGAPAPHYSRSVVAENGRAGFAIPFAFNDPSGPWKIIVRDIASGVRTTAEILVK